MRSRRKAKADPAKISTQPSNQQPLNITMKRKLTLLALAAAPLWINSCAPAPEYHTVTVHEYTHHTAPAPAPTDDPRAFVPKEKF